MVRLDCRGFLCFQEECVADGGVLEVVFGGKAWGFLFLP